MRDTQKIRAWMAENRWGFSDIARALGMGHVTHVWETVEGKRNSRKVLQWFIDNGCPTGYLGLPEWMKEAA